MTTATLEPTTTYTPPWAQWHNGPLSSRVAHAQTTFGGEDRPEASPTELLAYAVIKRTILDMQAGSKWQRISAAGNVTMGGLVYWTELLNDGAGSPAVDRALDLLAESVYQKYGLHKESA